MKDWLSAYCIPDFDVNEINMVYDGEIIEVDLDDTEQLLEAIREKANMLNAIKLDWEMVKQDIQNRISEVFNG